MKYDTHSNIELNIRFLMKNNYFNYSLTEMNTWDEDECNQYVGTDSSIFHALWQKEDRKFHSQKFQIMIILIKRLFVFVQQL